jgi:hypothetical protein
MTCMTPLETSTSDLIIFALALFELMTYTPEEFVVNERGWPEEEMNALGGEEGERRVGE